MSSSPVRTWALVGGLAAAAIVLAFLLVRGEDEGGGEDRIEVVDSRRLGPRLLEYTTRTPSVSGDHGLRILLPEDYEDSDRSYPVLYLLHPARGDERFWTDTARADELTEGLPLIVVMPDGGPVGFYSDWRSAGSGSPPQWEAYHVEELIPWVDSEFRTVDSAAGRTIAGASMGGLGALMYTARHPDLFSATASFSAPAEVRPESMSELLALASRGPELGSRIWGPPETELVNWVRHDPVGLAKEFEGVEVILHVGNGRPASYRGPLRDPVETLLRGMNVRLHRRLSELGIEHVWAPDVGAHNLTQMRKGLARSLPVLLEAVGEEEQ